MALRNLFFVMFTAIAIAMVIAFVVAPRLKEQAAAPAPVTVAVATPEPAPSAGSRAAFIDREDDGHFWTRADVSGTQVKFMVDTGASIVALTYFDAQRLGLKPEELDFDSEIRTAGGITYGAPVTLESIRVGKVEIENVNAVILRTELEQSLLGMTFLGELHSYEVRQGQMIIRQ
ncbi:TIGR02281 family clan AA aspartic protease [Hyphomonas sp.]|uniref:retropepsin-like aspartic protease family protein n=1 Tax=Hyphomonas sp. TaxID=87 RepID=UPI000A61E01F|nr:TIGR02281 family clan AA aspartic protease [Hyphomonas sp.]MBA4339468.1 TIGR02281 family clan AA aspartic protease [Hyphomonas sp.]